MANAQRDQNFVPTLLGVSNVDEVTPVAIYADPITHRLLVDLPGGSGTVSSFTFTDANGFDGTVTDSTTAPTLSLTTTVADTRVMFSSSGAITGDSGLTYNSATDSLTVAGTLTASVRVITPDLRAASSSGLLIEASNGTDVALYGSLNGSGVLYYGSLSITGSLLPVADNTSPIGAIGEAWSDLYMGSGAVLNFANDSIITHSAGILTVSTGDLRVTTAGTNTASVVTVGGTQTLTSKTLTSPTINTATLGGASIFAEGGSIAYDSDSSADGVYTGFTRAGVAGATLAFGDLVYLAAADSRWELADADAASTADRFLGICVLAAAADGDPTTILLTGFIRADAAFPAMTIGSPVYVGETAGDIQVAIPTGADNVIRRVGYAWTADELYFNPSMDSQTTVA